MVVHHWKRWGIQWQECDHTAIRGNGLDVYLKWWAHKHSSGKRINEQVITQDNLCKSKIPPHIQILLHPLCIWKQYANEAHSVRIIGGHQQLETGLNRNAYNKKAAFLGPMMTLTCEPEHC